MQGDVVLTGRNLCTCCKGFFELVCSYDPHDCADTRTVPRVSQWMMIREIDLHNTQTHQTDKPRFTPCTDSDFPYKDGWQSGEDEVGEGPHRSEADNQRG